MSENSTVDALKEDIVGRKKSEESKPRRYGTQIRVSDAFADLIVQAANQERLSVAVYIDKHLKPIVEKRYADGIMKEAERLKKGAKS